MQLMSCHKAMLILEDCVLENGKSLELKVFFCFLQILTWFGFFLVNSMGGCIYP